jgi:hypothetical protein
MALVRVTSVLHFFGFLGLSLATACAGSVSESALPGHGFVIRCEKGMSQCIRRAETLCKEDGYTIVAGREVSKVLGGQTSAYRKLVTQGELELYCGERAPKPACQAEEQDETAVYQLSGESAPPAAPPSPTPVASQAAAPASPAVPAEPPAPARSCVPGSTQRCVGPGACDGGQVCSPDGMSFGSCDCGPGAKAP